MQIVFLDSKTVVSDGIDISPLSKLGIVSLYPRTESTFLKQRLRGADIVLTKNVPIDADSILAARSLKLICILGNDLSLIDLGIAARKSITVCYVADNAYFEKAQHTVALLLEMCSHVGYHNRKIHNGSWCSSQDFCWWEKPSIPLCGKTVGIIGCGSTGKVVSKIFNSFGMTVLGYDIHPQNGFEGKYVSLDELLSFSDIISLHCPVNSDTLTLIDNNTIARMKPGAFIVNVSSGKLVSEPAICKALENGLLGGYATDSISTEPPSVHNPLLKAPNCVISGHCSCSSFTARQQLIYDVSDIISAFLSDSPINLL